MDYGNFYMVFHNKVFDFDRKYLLVLDLCLILLWFMTTCGL
jgi:hypothetical protein